MATPCPFDWANNQGTGGRAKSSIALWNVALVLIERRNGSIDRDRSDQSIFNRRSTVFGPIVGSSYFGFESTVILLIFQACGNNASQMNQYPCQPPRGNTP